MRNDLCMLKSPLPRPLRSGTVSTCYLLELSARKPNRLIHRQCRLSVLNIPFAEFVPKV